MAQGLLIVDVQNDFSEGGALGVAGGGEVARGVSALLREHPHAWDVVVASRDGHSPEGDNGGHFAADAPPDFVATWPVHCVEGTPGADYHPDLATGCVDVHVVKGRGRPDYSAFQGETDDGRRLVDVLSEHGVSRLDVVGLATDHCVRASALDALDAGLAVRVLTDLVAGVAPGPSEEALAEIVDAGGLLATSTVLAAGTGATRADATGADVTRADATGADGERSVEPEGADR